MSRPSPLRVAIIGAGRRVRELYVPALEALAPDFTIVGFASRGGASASDLARERGGIAFQDVADLLARADADLIVVAVGAQANAAVAMQSIASGRAVLMETPIGLTPAEGRRVVRRAAQAKAPVGVAEQKPFLALECLKRRLIAKGAIGRVLVADNDFHSLDHHAMAQLRLMLAPEARPIAAQAIRAAHPIAAAGPQSTEAGRRTEAWLVGTVQFDDGSMLTHRSTSLYTRTPFRTFRSLRVYGSRGTIVNDDVAMVDESGEVTSIRVRRAESVEASVPDWMACTLPGGEEVTWTNPCAGRALTDDQMAVGQHLVAMSQALRSGAPVLYGPHDALLDVELMDALSQSATKGGVPVAIAHRCADPACRPAPRSKAVGRRMASLGRQLAGSTLVRGVVMRARARGRQR